MPSKYSGTDFIAYDPDGQVVLLAEAKSRRGTSEDWATQLKRNMLSHGSLPWSKFFLIATAVVPPELTLNAVTVFRPYFERFHLEPSDVGPEAFELLVLQHHVAREFRDAGLSVECKRRV